MPPAPEPEPAQRSGGDAGHVPGRAFPHAVIVLAGGSGRRLGGRDKAALTVGGSSLLDRAIAAAAGRPVVVVGPARALPAGVMAAREDPPGGGPAAGVAAGFAVLAPLLGPGDALLGPADAGRPASPLVAVLAVDQPGVTSATLARLAGAVPPAGRGNPGAVLLGGGRRQYTAGVFRAAALAGALRGRDDWHDVALRLLLDPLVGAEVPAGDGEADDVDTPQDLARWRARTGDRPDGSGGPGAG